MPFRIIYYRASVHHVHYSVVDVGGGGGLSKYTKLFVFCQVYFSINFVVNVTTRLFKDLILIKLSFDIIKNLLCYKRFIFVYKNLLLVDFLSRNCLIIRS